MSRQFKHTVSYYDFTSKDIEQFAADNGYQYVKSEAVEHTESGYYMGPTHYNEKVDIVRWTDKEVEFEFYTRFFTAETAEKLSDQYNDHKRSRLLMGLVFSMRLPYQMPSVMVQSLTSRTIWNVLGWTALFVGKKVSLEGDFNQFFKVYTPSGEAPNAFLALAPDTMVKMLRTGSGMDFQFAGDRIYFMYDIRLKAKSHGNLWGLFGDFIKIDLRKDLQLRHINHAEWLAVFSRSREYSKDILKAFRALKQRDEAKRVYYIPMTNKNVSKIIIALAASLAAVIALAFWLPAALLALFVLLLANGVYRYLSWSRRRRRLLQRWDEGNTTVVVR